MPSKIHLATGIMGAKVKTKSGDRIGEIHNLMVDSTDGKLVYVVLCFDGFPGKVRRYFAIPRSALMLDPNDEGQFILDVEKEELKHAPGFSPERWSLTPCQEGVQSIYELYGYNSRSSSEPKKVNSH